MRPDLATQRQIEAADPAASTWLSANAGSGKTRVLTDRVARLLLSGVGPQHILCLTYTKAAASEMQNRLFARLGRWVMLDEAALRAELAALGVDTELDADMLARARRLFARAIETPGGLKIQTIHAFCASLLRRFPLEAGISPHFTEIDDRSARRLREDVLQDLALDAPDIVDGLMRHVTDEQLDRLVTEIISKRADLTPPLDRSAIWALFGMPADFDEATLLGSAFTGEEPALMRAIVPDLTHGKTTDLKLAERLSALDLAQPGLGELRAMEDCLLTGAKAKEPYTAKIGSLPTKEMRTSLGARLPPFEDLMRRIECARSQRITLAAAERTNALHCFAGHFLKEMEARKARRGWLDFDDLIARAHRLLDSSAVAQWVLFKLDGGVDHILVDEAQDTSPLQWRVIECLSREFTAGEGAHPGMRSIFMVGDKKQSIYSFQGADLRVFDSMRTQFDRALDQLGLGLGKLVLEHSFRSSAAILQLVDLTFNAGRGRGLGGEVGHIAFHADMPGRVDLWPPEPKADKEAPGDWWDPVDIIPPEHHTIRLAHRIAQEIAGMIRLGIAIPSGSDGSPRPVREGDFLILVRRRSELFHRIIAACKAEGLSIAGADKMNLGAELAVKDLVALLAFLATPEDDLSLAAVLRSPLFGWSEATLFDLAHGRGEQRLWQALRADPRHAEAVAVLTDLRDQADFLRPYELLERMLTRHDGRRRLLARLGPEAEDGIDSLLAQALGFEQAEIPSLTGFLVWLSRDELQVKRQLDNAGNRIRVMTVHGAKGLESPVVILPDTATRGSPRESDLLALASGTIIWKTPADEATPLQQEAQEAARAMRAEEDSRLLYVAMTRAENWLIVAAAGDTGDGSCWYDQVADGMHQAGSVATEFSGGTGLRLSHGIWPDAVAGEVSAASEAPVVPDWANSPAPAVAPTPELISPSDLGGAKSLPGEYGLVDEDTAKRRGRQIHLLLEHLPRHDRAQWPAMAASLLAVAGEPAYGASLSELLAEAGAVLEAPDLGFLFGPEALAEIAITASLDGRRLHGVIDRLLVSPHRVLAVDFKSNRIVPETPELVPDGLLWQMAAYARALDQIYPDRAVEVALLWTRTARLMPLPSYLLHASLAEAGA